MAHELNFTQLQGTKWMDPEITIIFQVKFTFKDIQKAKKKIGKPTCEEEGIVLGEKE